MAVRSLPSVRKKFRVACLQINASANWRRNLTAVQKKIKQALRLKPHLITLPETFYYRGPSHRLEFLARKVTPAVIAEFRHLARRHQVAFLLGSVFEKAVKGKYYNASILISEKGRLAARYHKIHLFDIALKDKLKATESRHIAPGHRVVQGQIWGVPVGLTICYDLRFPELFRRLSKQGSRIIFVPANFTYTTGKAHWEILLRARAIENQVYIVAPAQVGIHPSTKIKAFGASLLIDPWGRIIGRASLSKEEILVGDLDLDFQTRLRSGFPVLKHRRLFG